MAPTSPKDPATTQGLEWCYQENKVIYCNLRKAKCCQNVKGGGVGGGKSQMKNGFLKSCPSVNIFQSYLQPEICTILITHKRMTVKQARDREASISLERCQASQTAERTIYLHHFCKFKIFYLYGRKELNYFQPAFAYCGGIRQLLKCYHLLGISELPI